MIPEIPLKNHPITGKPVPEKWFDIDGYVGYYQVSNYGRVKSLARKDSNNHPVNERLLKPDYPKGYARVTLCKPNSTNKRFMVHTLVARHFILNTLNKPCVNHEDGVKSNNFEFNLSWVTYSENTLHGFRTGLIKPPRAHLGRRGDLHHRSKKVLQLSLDGKSIKTWESSCLAADSLNLSQSNISSVCLGKRSQTGGFKWSFI